ncbi:MAG: tol-pal system protein YbgF [Trichloromonadaceae bacterium]
MLNLWKKSVLSLALLSLVAGCIPTQRELQLDRDLTEMKRRLAETERGVATVRQGGETKTSVDNLSRQQAELQAAVDTLRVEIQSFSGRFEDVGRERGGVRDELKLIRDDMGLKLTALEDRVSKLEARMQGGMLPTGAATAAPAPGAETPQALYERGLDLIQRQGDMPRGREVLQEFLKKYPQDPLAVNAMYWIGESYYGEKKYENAILQFQDVIQKYGDHPKVASALYKQGLSFQALGDNKNAKVILKKVVDTFPLAEEAKRAKEKLATIK